MRRSNALHGSHDMLISQLFNANKVNENFQRTFPCFIGNLLYILNIIVLLWRVFSFFPLWLIGLSRISGWFRKLVLWFTRSHFVRFGSCLSHGSSLYYGKLENMCLQTEAVVDVDEIKLRWRLFRKVCQITFGTVDILYGPQESDSFISDVTRFVRSNIICVLY